jgi:hypothetical protein
MHEKQEGVYKGPLKPFNSWLGLFGWTNKLDSGMFEPIISLESDDGPTVSRTSWNPESSEEECVGDKEMLNLTPPRKRRTRR